MVNKFLFINDLHFGIPDTEREYNELQKHFIPYIKEHDLDVIFFGGDYFDHKLSLGETSSLLGLQFFNQVVNICKEKDIKIRIIEGTQSHDRFQPKVLENLITESGANLLFRMCGSNQALLENLTVTPDKDIDYKYFEVAEVEDLLGMKVLYVPEEYPMNIDEYYSKFKEMDLDLMIMHCTWDFIGFGGEADNKRNDIHSAPIFVYKEWEKALSHGTAICGHIHGRHGYKTPEGMKIIYPASFTAWSFDQISDRGFLYGEFDTDKHTLHYEFINNPDSPKFANLDIGDLGLDLNTTDIDVIKNKIQEQKDKVDHLKVNLDALPNEKKLVLKDYYKENRDIIPDVSASKVLFEASNNEEFKKYDYLLQDKLTIEQAIQKFMKENMNIEMTEEQIKEIITEEKK